MLSGAAEYIIPWISRRYILTDVSCCSCLNVAILVTIPFSVLWRRRVDSFTDADGQLSAQPLPSLFDSNRYTLGMTGTSRHPSVIWEPAKQQNAGRWKRGENRSRDSGFVQASGMSISVNPHAPALLLQLIICPTAALSLHNILCAVIYSWLVHFPHIWWCTILNIERESSPITSSAQDILKNGNWI